MKHMDFPNYFADAESSFDDSKFVIFGVPFDKTSSFRLGARKAPKEIRKASWNFETFNLKTGRNLKNIKIHDYGNLNVTNDSPKEMITKVKDFTSRIIKKDKIPIALGGEHSITPGIIQAFPKDIAVISLDAHIDFRNKYEDEPFNHACANRRIVDVIGSKNIAILGIRSTDEEELIKAQEQKIFYIDSFEIKKHGIKNAIDKTKKHLGKKPIYLTLDIDVLDPAYAPGTSTPEPFGLDSFEILEIFENFSEKLVGFDIVEVCPPYDFGETALIAAKFIRILIDLIDIKKHD